MSATPDSTLADPERLIADLQRQLAEREAEVAEYKAERDKALQRETATSEVLQVINSSPGDLGPVFDAMLEKATRLCEAPFGILRTWDGERFHLGAVHGDHPRYSDWAQRRGPIQPDQDASPLGRILAGEKVVHFADVPGGEGYLTTSGFRDMVEASGIHSAIWVALRKDDALLGVIIVYRQEVRPFSDKEIALLENFAAQAVIAMENARLLTETREALEQQTATAEILRVISGSPTDVQPTFDAIAAAATTLTDAALSAVATYDGRLMHLAALSGFNPAEMERLRHVWPLPADRGTATGRAILTRQVVHIEDLAVDPDRGYPALDRSSGRTVLAVPMLRDGIPIGAINVQRRDVQPFTDKQVDLFKIFADQAVIAIENVRLFNETREALEQQTATAEVLQVINSSPGDLTPVFDALLEKAMQLCEATFGGLTSFDGERFHTLALRGLPAEAVEVFREPWVAGPGTYHENLVRGEPLVHTDFGVPDPARRAHPQSRAIMEMGKARTGLIIALCKDERLLGSLFFYRQEVRPFSDKQIALLENFATQAVIAMENARLITETREALDRQTATSEVLGIISSSPGRLEPVFDAILVSAVRVCAGKTGMLALIEDGGFRGVAVHRVGSEFAATLSQLHHPPPGTGLDLLQKSLHTIQIADCAAEPAYDAVRALNPAFAAVRTALHVPMIRDAELLGAIMIYRDQVESFDDKEIELVENFAKQAVIAIENTRLIAEIREALDQQTATAEVLQVINSSPGDLDPVFEAMVQKAITLCDAASGTLWTCDGERFDPITVGGASRLGEWFRQHGPTGAAPDTPGGRLLSGERVVHIADVKQDPAYRAHPRYREMADLENCRTFVAVGLRKEDTLLGMITAYRQQVRPFSDKQVALLQNFAAQAVIAMENARLITETREALERQTATAEILGVINSSPGDLAPVFDAMLEKATRLCEAAFGVLWTHEGESFRAAALRGVPPAYAEFVTHAPRGSRPGGALGRLALGEAIVHVPDTSVDGQKDPVARTLVELGGIRTLLAVPLCKDSALLGAFTIYRQEVRPFTDKQIALLQNFATQAVIAMENARLLDEIRQRQAELRVTFDNMADGVVMFDENLRLAAWNRNFQEMLDLSDAVLVSRPTYADYVRMLVARGEFGTGDIETELNRRLEHTDQEFLTERTRPNGRVIEVRRNTVPDGGFVLIYSDITERKRSEAEIHAARDAAETAYRDLKAAQASLIQAEKMASLGQLTAGIAHEIKNPLNFVNNFADLSVELLDELKETTASAIAALDDDKRIEIDETIEMLSGNLDKIAEHGRRADGIVKSMLEHSRGSSSERRSVDLNGLIEESLNLAYHGGRAQDQSFNITLERDYAAAMAPIELVPQDITRVCLNLIGNGFYATTKRQKEGTDPKFKPTLKVSTRDLGNEVEIRVRDNGTGIAPEFREKLFQPFFTTKPTGEGTGLGLSISYDIVTQQHGGTITIDSRVGEFTEFTVRLPRTFAATIAEAAS